MNLNRLIICALCSIAALSGCGAAPSDPPPGSTSPTYTRDIAPLLARECTSCHSAGAIGPFPLATYEDARAHAQEIAFAVRARIMPPYGVDNSGDCNTYREARWLSDEEIALFDLWADAGAPRGEGEPAAPPVGEAPRALAPTTTVDIGAAYTPDITRPDDYRCFVVDLGVSGTRYLTGFAVHPGERRIVHHIILFGLASAEAEAKARELDAAEPGPGYTCFGGPGTNDIRFLLGWAPGVSETHYPDRTGIEVPAQGSAVMQIHYHALETPLSDRTTIDLELVESVELPAIVLPLAQLELQLAPGMPNVSVEASGTLEDPPAVDVYGVFPHMHKLGRSMRAEHHRGGESSCLVDVPRWQFEWQQFYFYDQPIRVDVGDRVDLTCTYDTSSRREPIEWGEGTDDEMCLAGFYLVKLP